VLFCTSSRKQGATQICDQFQKRIDRELQKLNADFVAATSSAHATIHGAVLWSDEVNASAALS
jgi:hypothetical protein